MDARLEATRLARAKLRELESLSWDELDAYVERVEETPSESGRRFRVKSYTFWDMEPWESDMYVKVKVYAPRGLRRLWPYTVVGGRGGEELPR